VSYAARFVALDGLSSVSVAAALCFVAAAVLSGIDGRVPSSSGRAFFSLSEAPGYDRELGWARWSKQALVDIPIDPDDLASADAVAAEVAAAVHAGDYSGLGPNLARPVAPPELPGRHREDQLSTDLSAP